METVTVEADDAARLLAAMLEGVKAERGEGSGVRMAKDAEDAALFAEAVAILLAEAVLVREIPGFAHHTFRKLFKRQRQRVLGAED
jgi:hypothetical protein